MPNNQLNQPKNKHLMTPKQIDNHSNNVIFLKSISTSTVLKVLNKYDTKLLQHMP